MTIYRMSEACAVAGQIRPEDVANIAADGFTTVVCNRPDLEEFGQPLADDIRRECESHELAFHFIPIDRSGLTVNMVEEFRRVVDESAGPVLAYCRSGQRSAVIWQASGSP
ncbi:MAG: TIGR01244 family phosphatase [Gammaproteobacteria bacterium]|nr:TIGR01244 family phosphatase [Gammaproteobacteria bacterium]